MNKWCALDTETGGLDCHGNPILSLSICQMLSSMELTGETLNLRFKANRPCSPKALQVNKLDPEQGLSHQECVNRLTAWMHSNHIERIHVIAHNAIFDMNFIKYAWLANNFNTLFTGHYECTLSAARTVSRMHYRTTGKPRFAKHSLAYLCEELGIKTPEHNAEGDMEAMVKVYRRLICG